MKYIRAINYDDIKKCFDNVQNPNGIMEIVLMKSEIITEGRPVLMLHPNDYEKYAESLVKK